MLGFGLWRYEQMRAERLKRQGRKAKAPPRTAPLEEPLLFNPPTLSATPPAASLPAELRPPQSPQMCASPPQSFQERIVGLGRVTAAGAPGPSTSVALRRERESFVWGVRTLLRTPRNTPSPAGRRGSAP